MFQFYIIWGKNWGIQLVPTNGEKWGTKIQNQVKFAQRFEALTEKAKARIVKEGVELCPEAFQHVNGEVHVEVDNLDRVSFYIMLFWSCVEKCRGCADYSHFLWRDESLKTKQIIEIYKWI